jgi:hypothetical protein
MMLSGHILLNSLDKNDVPIPNFLPTQYTPMDSILEQLPFKIEILCPISHKLSTWPICATTKTKKDSTSLLHFIAHEAPDVAAVVLCLSLSHGQSV